MHWKIKGLVQGVLARVPGGTRVNDRLQVLVGGRRDSAHYVDLKFEADWLVLMDLLAQQAFSVRGRDLLEIGTGWAPVLPLAMALAGAGQVHTFDLHRHLVPSAVHATLARLQRHLDALARAAGEPVAAVRERHAWFMAAAGPEKCLERAGVRYHAPADAAATGLAEGSVALVFSNSVLEHVGAELLGPLMQESRRVLLPDGLALHGVNCADHYAHFDRSLSPIHYLRFSARAWRRWNNELLYQNRLRPSDFVAAAEAEGLRIVQRIQTVRAELIPRLADLPVAAEFRHYSDEDLCTTSITFVASPRGSVRPRAL